jgi:hypothetical protein
MIGKQLDLILIYHVVSALTPSEHTLIRREAKRDGSIKERYQYII